MACLTSWFRATQRGDDTVEPAVLCPARECGRLCSAGLQKQLRGTERLEAMLWADGLCHGPQTSECLSICRKIAQPGRTPLGLEQDLGIWILVNQVALDWETWCSSLGEVWAVACGYGQANVSCLREEGWSLRIIAVIE